MQNLAILKKRGERPRKIFYKSLENWKCQSAKLPSNDNLFFSFPTNFRFSWMAEWLPYFDFYDFEDNFVFACNFLAEFFIFSTNRQ